MYIAVCSFVRADGFSAFWYIDAHCGSWKIERRGQGMKVCGNEEMENGMKNMLNAMSGAYTSPLIDKLFPAGEKVSDMEGIYSALAALLETGRVTEAMQMVRGLFGIAGEEYPYLIEALGRQKEMQGFFISEFLADFYEMIDERRLDEE